MIRIALLAALLILSPAGAMGASSAWVETEGGRLRLVTAEAAGADGALRALLQIDLAAGWKTYWKDPGDAGIAPQLDIAASVNVDAVEILFPPPVRFAEGRSVSTGYTRPVELPVLFRLSDPAKFTSVDATVFLGICKEICVPVEARLEALPSGAPGADDPAIAAAFARLPAPASAALGISRFRDEGQVVTAEAAPGSARAAELYVVAPPGWVLGVPEPVLDGAVPAFRIAVVRRPEAATGATTIDYTLTAGDEAVEGRLELR